MDSPDGTKWWPMVIWGIAALTISAGLGQLDRSLGDVRQDECFDAGWGCGVLRAIQIAAAVGATVALIPGIFLLVSAAILLAYRGLERERKAANPSPQDTNAAKSQVRLEPAGR